MSFSDALLFGCAALIILESLLAIMALQTRKHTHLMLQGQIAVHRPWALRVAIALFSITAASWPLLILDNVSTYHVILPSRTWVLFTFAALLSFAVSLVCFRASGPDDLLLIPKTRTYQRSMGWPIFPKVCSGTWNDIAGIYVRENGASSKVYIVCIAWATQSGETQLGHFYQVLRATQFADEMCEELSLKRISSPRR